MSSRSPDGAGRLSRIRQPAAPGGPLSIDPAPPDAVAAERSSAGGYRQLAELLDQEASWLSSAHDWRGRAGASGKSRMNAQELPLEWKPGWNRGNRWFFQAAPARVSSGALDLADSAQAATFGAVLLCQPLCGEGSLPQVAK